MSQSKSIEVLTTIPFPEPVLSRMRGLSPKVKVTLFPAKSSEEIAPEIWNRTEILYTDILLPEPGMVPNLKWVQFHYAGIDFALGSKLMKKDGLLITSMSGASAVQEGEYILMMLLGLGHRLPELIANQHKQDWPAERWEKFTPLELTGSTVGLIGYGSIGREVARLLQPFNAKVLAVKGDVMHPIDSGYTLPGHGDVDGNFFHRLYPVQAIKSMVKECDFVVVSLPLTPDTRGLISEEVLNGMKPTSFLIHISRGGIVNEQALADALQNRRIAGAAIDVFSQEPLPQNHPLWKVPNLIVTPHVSGFSPRYKERAGEMFVENLARYLKNEPLLNQFNPERHY